MRVAPSEFVAEAEADGVFEAVWDDDGVIEEVIEGMKGGPL